MEMCRDYDDVQINGFRTVNTRRFTEVIQGTYKLKNFGLPKRAMHDFLATSSDRDALADNIAI